MRYFIICSLLVQSLMSIAQPPPVYSGWTVYGSGPSSISIEPRSGTDLWLEVTSSHCAHGTHQYFNTVAGTSYRIDFDLDLGTTTKVNLLIWDVTPGGTLYNTRIVTYTAGGNDQSQTFLASDTRALIQFRQDTCTGTHSFYLDNIHITEVSVTNVVMIDSLDTQYRYGFNGQEKDNELYGSGNAYTAEYWEYDARLGRRWNPDPVENPEQSSYAVFFNNPIFYNDPSGAWPPRILDRNRPHVKYEYRTVSVGSETVYQRRRHYYNINYRPSTAKTDWYTITELTYHHGKKWEYVDPGGGPVRSEKTKVAGDDNDIMKQTINTERFDHFQLKLEYSTYQIDPDKFVINMVDGDGNVTRQIGSAGNVETGYDFRKKNFNITPEPGEVGVQIEVVPGPHNEWDYEYEITGSSTPGRTPYSDGWNDNWNNDSDEGDYLVTPHYDTGNADHQY